MNFKTIALSLILWTALLLPAGAQPQPGCTRETLSVRGVPVTVSYCILAADRSVNGREATVSVQETYASPRGSFGQIAPLSFLTGTDPSRVIEDVALTRLGLPGMLHLTLIMRSGRVLIEAALLTPGAIIVK